MGQMSTDIHPWQERRDSCRYQKSPTPTYNKYTNSSILSQAMSPMEYSMG